MRIAVALALAAGLSGSAFAAEVSVAENGHASNPKWAPDGSWLAFEVNDFQGTIDLYVIKVQNGNPVGTPQQVVIPGASSAFSTGGTIAAAPIWNPKNQLIFEGSNAGGTNRLYFFVPGGQSAAELLTTQQISGDLSWPSISSDGKLIVFISDATGSGDIYQWSRSSNAVTQLLGSEFSEASPAFAPDNLRVAFSRKNRGAEDLFVLDAGNATPYMGGNGDQSRPAFAGEKVVFFSNERGEDHWDIVVGTGPGQKLVLAQDVRLPIRAAPSVSPDAKWVAYGVYDPEKAKSIYLTAVDGSRTVEIQTGLIAAGEPHVVDAGGRVYLAFTALPSEGADWRALHIKDITEKVR